MAGFVLLGGGAFFAATAIGFAVAASRRRAAALALVGVAIPAVLLLWAYLGAPRGYPRNGCSDCGEHLGRWWEPYFVAFVGVVNLLGWAAGVATGAAARRIARRERG